MKSEEKKIYVWFNHRNSLINMGILFVSNVRGNEVFAFEFSNEFLSSPFKTIFIDQDIGNYIGKQYLYDGKEIFNVFSDLMPDRWGRKLLGRRERFLAKKEGRKPKKLMASDYLLGVFDEGRMGCIRLSESKDGDFVSNSKEIEIPPIEDIRALEQMALEFEENDDVDKKWIEQLVGPGSSLGGARPKVTIKDRDGSLWIAKFPSKNDDYDVGAWEKVSNDLAVLCGLNVPESRLLRFSKYGSIFLSKRFDRDGKERIHFISAMTALGKSDGDGESTGVGYSDIASFVISYGVSPENDILELWKRMVFNIAISNCDDHLRNHGFLLSKTGYKLAPAYDLNPSIGGNGLSLNVFGESNELSFELAMKEAKELGIDETRAKTEMDKIIEIVSSNWKNFAAKYKIDKSQISLLSECFSSNG